MELKKKKLKKWREQGIFEKKLKEKIKECYEDFINDFVYLAKKNNWTWVTWKITKEIVLEDLVSKIENILLLKEDMLSSGRILVKLKETEKCFLIDLAIDYYGGKLY